MRFFLTGTNYCGPGGDGDTTSGVDEACRAHDKAYGDAGYSSYLKNQKADTMFLSNLAKVRSTGLRQRFTKAFAQRYFGFKVGLWNMAKYARYGDEMKYQTRIPDYYSPIRRRGRMMLRKRTGIVRTRTGMRPRQPRLQVKTKYHRYNVFNRLRRSVYKKRFYRRRR